MDKLTKYVRLKIAAISALVGLTIAIVTIPKTYADSPTDTSNSALAVIANNTQQILAAVNELPAYLNNITLMAISWLAQDDSSAMANNQADYANWVNQYSLNQQTQLQLQTQLLNDFLKINSGNVNKLPFVNDLTYPTLLGQPLVSPDPRNASGNTPVDSVYNYLQNVAGLNLSLPMPSPSWTGNQIALANYSNLYKTLTAIQTYNAYVLSELYADYKNTSSQTDPAKKDLSLYLMQQASNSEWFAQVAGEKLGVVLRQILVYNSQTYVLLNQLVKTQQQLATSQAMTNTLLILLNQGNANLLLQQARGS